MSEQTPSAPQAPASPPTGPAIPLTNPNLVSVQHSDPLAGLIMREAPGQTFGDASN